MRRRSLVIVLVATVVACVPESDDQGRSVPYVDAPASVATGSMPMTPGRGTGGSDAAGVGDGPCAGPGLSERVADPPDWIFSPQDVDVSPDGRLVTASPQGVAYFDPSTGWEPVDTIGLPEGAPEQEWWARVVESIAAGDDGSLWAAGTAFSSLDDVEFGGAVDEWMCARRLDWVARRDCTDDGCSWTPYTSDQVQWLEGGIVDVAVRDDGMLFASVGDDGLVTFDGTAWRAYRVPGRSSYGGPWSLAVGADGVLHAATHGDTAGVEGVLSFEGGEFAGVEVPSELLEPGDHLFQVEVGSDGSLWASTDRLYESLESARPDDTAGVLRFDGASWTRYTMDDGLLSNDAWIAAGDDGTVWAIHGEFPPTGYSRFDGAAWTAFPSDRAAGGGRPVVASDGTLWWPAEGGLMRFDGVTETFYPTAFDFRRDDLCEWVSADQVAGFVEEAYGWEATAASVPSRYAEWDCVWILTGADGGEGEVLAGEPEWKTFGGAPIDLAERMTTDVADFADLSESLPIGVTVAGHPALGDGVVVLNGGFGQIAFGVPPRAQYLQVSVLVPDDEDWELVEPRFLAVANRILGALGWLSGEDPIGTPVSAP